MSLTIYNLDDWLWDIISNKLSLVLKPIRVVLNTHLLFISVEFFNFVSFSKRVSQNLLSIDLQKFDVTSIYDLSY